MAQQSWPSPSHNDREVTDAEYETIAGRFSDDGVYGSPLDTAVVTAGAGLSVNVRANVRGSLRGHAWTSGSTTVNLAVDANASGQTRVDLVVLRLDRSAWTVRAVIKKGTPGSGAPALTQDTGDTGTFEVLVAQVTLLSGAGTVTVKRYELYVGSRIRPLTSTTPNALALPGELGYETNTGNVTLWTGSAKKVVYSDALDVDCDSPIAAWEITVASVLDARSGNVHVRLGTWNRKGGTLANNADSRLPVLIPAAYRHRIRNMYADCYITGARIGRVTIYPANHDRAGQVWLTQKPSLGNGDDVLPGSVSWVV
ncbi:hypothetical protein [Streptomyces sp. NPDC047070]|uniref:hypothetical protein n=1 Tax=Streptomyces sp. NPDC047070 TaxID=3154923 RepID=UPI0034540C2A